MYVERDIRLLDLSPLRPAYTPKYVSGPEGQTRIAMHAPPTFLGDREYNPYSLLVFLKTCSDKYRLVLMR